MDGDGRGTCGRAPAAVLGVTGRGLKWGVWVEGRAEWGPLQGHRQAVGSPLPREGRPEPRGGAVAGPERSFPGLCLPDPLFLGRPSCKEGR